VETHFGRWRGRNYNANPLDERNLNDVCFARRTANRAQKSLQGIELDRNTLLLLDSRLTSAHEPRQDFKTSSIEENKEMTNEEMQSTIHFILQQQAQFSVNQQLMQENFVRLEETVNRLSERVDKLAERMDKLAESQESLHRLVGAIAVAQATTEANLSQTDKRLNDLIAVVERYISERRNGNS
jgi:hypothetical protein